MAIKILNRRYEYYDGSAVNWALANVGEPIKITHDIAVETFAINSTDNEMILNNKNGYLTTGTECWVTGGNFGEFNVGDEVQVANYFTNTINGSAFIVEKLSPSEIKLSANPASWSPNTSGTQDVFSIKKKPTAIYYKWNFIENGDASTFLSLIDGTEQVAVKSGLDPALSNTYTMQMLGSKPYQLGTIQIVEAGLATNPIYSSRFTIIHDTRITPIMLASQWDDLLNGIAPDTFFNQNCLKGVFYFESRYSLTNPNDVQALLDENVLGNTGWFNENFNSGLTNYSINGLLWKQTSPFVTIPSCQLKVGNASKFEFYINNTTSSPFSNNNTELILNFAKAPNFESEYQSNNRDMLHNFVWESKKIKASTTPTTVNGDNYSDAGLRSLKSIKATYINATQIKIEGEIDMLQQAVDVFNESDEPRYLFFVVIQNHTLTGEISDRVTLMIESSPFYFKVDFPDLIIFYAFKIIPHDIANYTDSFILRDVFVEDELVGYCEFHPRTYDLGLGPVSQEFIRATGRVIAYNTSTNARFTLETNTINVSNTPVINGLQYFNITQNRAHHVPVNEIRKPIRFYYDTVANKYVFAYPYINDWSYWQPLQGVNNYFFDTIEPNNGLNKDWLNYSDGTWKVGFELEIAMKVNDVPALYSSKMLYDMFDRNLPPGASSGDGGVETVSWYIKTFDSDSLTELVDGTGKKYILGYKSTLVKCYFENGLSGYDDSQLTVVVGLEVYEEGGVNGKRRMSSRYDSDNDTWFMPLSGETRVKTTVLTSGPDAVLAEVLIDNTLININKNKYKITARLYQLGDIGREFAPYPSPSYASNYLASQDVYMIKENPVDEVIPIIDSKTTDCDSAFIWRVLADSVTNNELRNDVNSFIWWFNKDAITTATLFLVKKDGTEIDLTSNTSYGTPYNYGFFINNNNDKHVAYSIEWRKVLIALGECVYTVKCVVTNVFGGSQTLFSEPYCLKQYTNSRADCTVRVEYYINGILGRNDVDNKFRDFGTLNWYNQHRFDGEFHYNNSSYKEEEIQYINGEVINVEDEQTSEFSMFLKAIPFFKHNVLRSDILQSDKILVTDYNSKNTFNFHKKQVKRNSSYEPKWNILRTKLAPVEIKFKQSFNNLRKFISG